MMGTKSDDSVPVNSFSSGEKGKDCGPRSAQPDEYNIKNRVY